MFGRQPEVQRSRQESDMARRDCPTEKIYCDQQFVYFGASGLKNNVRKFYHTRMK
jgi:hypothetical protein